MNFSVNAVSALIRSEEESQMNHMENEMKEHCRKRFYPVIEKLNYLLQESQKETLLVAIDGKCASGKTTLSYYLQEQYDCNLFHMDDFFLRMEQRTPQRLGEVGGNVDYERFQEQVLHSLLAKRAVTYRKFSCKTGKLAEDATCIFPKRLNVIEGSYSMHPYFGDVYDLRIFTQIDEQTQIENIVRRNGDATRFMEEWIPKENAYFDQYHIREGCLEIFW